MRFHGSQVAAAIVLGLLGAASCGKEAASPAELKSSERGAATPEALFARLEKARASMDVDEFLACTPEEEHRQHAFEALYGLEIQGFVLFRTPAEGVPEAFEAFLARHDLGTLAEVRAHLPWQGDAVDMADFVLERLEDVDVRTFLKEADALSESWPPDGAAKATVLGELSDLRVFDDLAVGRAGGGLVGFVRHEGRWFLGPYLPWERYGRSDRYEPLPLYVPDLDALLGTPGCGATLLFDLEVLERIRERLEPEAVVSALPDEDERRDCAWARAFRLRKELPEASWARRLFEVPPEKYWEDLAAVVPAADTFALLQLRVPPSSLLEAAFGLSNADVLMWDENLSRMGQTHGLRGLIDALGLTGRAAVAYRRRPEVFDAFSPTAFFTVDAAPETEFPLAVALVSALLPAAQSPDRSEAFGHLVAGLGAQETTGTHRGVVYHRMLSDSGWLDVSQAAVAIVGEHLVATTSEACMRDVIDTILDPVGSPALGTTDAYSLPAQRCGLAGQRAKDTQSFYRPYGRGVAAALWIDVAAITRVPDEGQGYLWDVRQQWIGRERNPRTAALVFRATRLAELEAELGRPPTNAERATLHAEVDAFWDEWIARYPEFVSEYRERLQALDGPASLLFVYIPGRQFLQCDLVITR